MRSTSLVNDPTYEQGKRTRQIPTWEIRWNRELKKVGEIVEKKTIIVLNCSELRLIFVLLGGAQTWSPHIEPYKFLLRILKSNSTAENYTDVRLGQVVHSSIFYNIWNSWLQTFHSSEFRFRRRHSENHQYFASTICFEAKRSIKTSKRVGKVISHINCWFHCVTPSKI